MKQVVAIHGGDSYASYEEFLSELMKKAFHLDWLRFRDWKVHLADVLGSEYDVILPRMPNPQNAKYQEWKIWFEKLIPHLEDSVILIGHSLGGVFLAKYLSEEEPLPVRIAATFLVAAPFDADGARKLVEFNITNDLNGLQKQGGRIFLYHSTDDPVVDVGEVAKFQSRLPNATVRIFSDRQHFNQAEFPELVSDVQSLTLSL